jgi:hypothetical protein
MTLIEIMIVLGIIAMQNSESGISPRPNAKELIMVPKKLPADVEAAMRECAVRGRTLWGKGLFNQGLDWYSAIPNMKPDRLELLMTTFDDTVRRHAIFREIFGVI